MADRGPFGAFNRGFGRTERASESLVGWLVRRWAVAMGIFAAAIAAALFLVTTAPTAFVPDEDNGYFFVAYQLPPGSPLERTMQVADQVRAVLETQPEIETIIEIDGQNFIAGAPQSNSGVFIPVLKPWDDRPGAGSTTTAIVQRLQPLLWMIPGANAFAFNPPSIPGLGTVGGFQLQLVDRAGLGTDRLFQAAQDVIAAARERPDRIAGLATFFQKDVPQVWLEIDRVKMQRLGITVADAFAVLQLNFGSAFINQFNRFNQVYQVYVQADARFRMVPEDLGRLYVTNARRQMIPFSAFATARTTVGPDNLTHYNVTDTIAINGAAAPGRSSGDATRAMEEICAGALPPGITYEWTGIVYQERKSANAAPIVFTLAIVAVFLF
ncbi:MAG: efflux RND transporter permease subunit, partial [Phycisphaerales bacterium]